MTFFMRAVNFFRAEEGELEITLDEILTHPPRGGGYFTVETEFLNRAVDEFKSYVRFAARFMAELDRSDR